MWNECRHCWIAKLRLQPSMYNFLSLLSSLTVTYEWKVCRLVVWTYRSHLPFIDIGYMWSKKKSILGLVNHVMSGRRIDLHNHRYPIQLFRQHQTHFWYRHRCSHLPTGIMSETAFANREKPVFKNPQQPTSNTSQSLPNSQLRLLRASCCFPEQSWLRNGKTGFIQYDIIKWAKGTVQSEPAEAQISVFFSLVCRPCSKQH